MSLFQRFSVPPPGPNAKQYCAVGRMLDDLRERCVPDDPTSDYVSMVTVLADHHWASSVISRVLKEEGHLVSERHLRPHRRGDHTPANCLHPQVGVIK